MLSMAYAHTSILINRPFLLSNFASLKWGKTGTLHQNSGRPFETNIKECLDAAMIAVGIVDDYSAGQQVFPAFWVSSSLHGKNLSRILLMARIIVYPICRVLRRCHTLRLHYSAKARRARGVDKIF